MKNFKNFRGMDRGLRINFKLRLIFLLSSTLLAPHMGNMKYVFMTSADLQDRELCGTLAESMGKLRKWFEEVFLGKKKEKS